MLKILTSTAVSIAILSAVYLHTHYPKTIEDANTTHVAATCYGKTPCTACSNCSKCKHCSSGGTCGKCTSVKGKTYNSKAPVPQPEENNSRCKATTKQGTRCKRSATSGAYCWQHG